MQHVQKHAYAPGVQGELGLREFALRPPMPALAAVWAEAAPAALDFWAGVTADERISRDFRAVAQACGATIQRMVARYG